MADKDLSYLRILLPETYTLHKKQNRIICQESLSANGITDPIHWACVCRMIKKFFDDRYMNIVERPEINHKNFDIVLKY